MWQIGSLVRNTDNPDLGPGRVRQRDTHGMLSVRFSWKSVDVHFDPSRSPIERYKLLAGTPIQCQVDGYEGPVAAIVLGGSDRDSGDEIQSYRVGLQVGDDLKEADIPETLLFPLPPATNGPLDILRALHWQGPKRFFRRWRLRNLQSRWIEDSAGLPSLLGARIYPLGHQIYAVRRILWDRVPRFVLADEVGLGKTIEAGLVIQALRAEKPDLSVLILAPGAMARQWQMELYLRFGAQACGYLDGGTYTDLSAAARKRLFASRNLIATTTALQRFPEIAARLGERHWDLVVIDEAHQFPPGTCLYDFFHSLARQSAGLLALSATPSKREIASLAGLLALVAPDVYEPTDQIGLRQRLQRQREVWDRLSFTRKYVDAVQREGRGLDADDLDFMAGEWDGLLDGDPIVFELIGDLRQGDVAAPDKLVAYVQELHRLDHRIIRTRRSALQQDRQHWSERRVQRLEYDPDTQEAVLANHLNDLPLPASPSSAQLALRGLYYRCFASTPSRLAWALGSRRGALGGFGGSPLDEPLALLTADPGPGDEDRLIAEIVETTPPFEGELQWLDTALDLAGSWRGSTPVCRRTSRACHWLEEHLHQHASNQVLVFAQDRTVVEELLRVIRDRLPTVPVQGFHHGMDEAELAQVALKFQRNRDCRVLVSDELGGEGRNFQNASAVLHFDLPWSVARLEQRIGRLDRVGRGADRPVESVVLFGPTAVEGALLDIHEGVFQVFTRSVGGLEYALPRMQRELNEALCRGADALAAVGESLAQEVRRELQEVDEAFDLSLDASKYQLNTAEELAGWIGESGDDAEAAVTLAKWAKGIGIDGRSRHDRTWEFRWTAETLMRQPAGLSAEGFISGTFTRQCAMDDESQQFLGPGHPFVDALMEDLESSAEGRACVMAMNLGAGYRGKLFALAVVRNDLNEQRLAGAKVPHGLRLRARRFHIPEVQYTLMELHPAGDPAAAIVVDRNLVAQFRNPGQIHPQYRKIGPNQLGSVLNTLTLWAAVEEALNLALEHVREMRMGVPEEAAAQLAEDLRHEIGFFAWERSQQAEGGADGPEREIAARQALIESVRHERLWVDALAVIVGLA